MSHGRLSCWKGVRSTAPSGPSETATCKRKDQAMQLLPRPSSKEISTARDDRLDPTLPVILEYQSPSSAVINLPMPRVARGFTLTFTSMIVAMMIIAYVVSVDRVVTAGGLVVAKTSTIVIQPLEAP